MSRYHSYINSSKQILNQYDGKEPFASFLKNFFSQQKKYGSKDRKQISHLCYCYFRLGKALQDVAGEERILISLFLCSQEPNEILQELKPAWNERIALSAGKKIELLGHDVSFENIFPWANQLSEAINKKKFAFAHLQQPDLFLRLRPGKEAIVKKKLREKRMEYKVMSDDCIALANSSKVDTVIELNKEAVIQDYSSQGVGAFIKAVKEGLPGSVWDCCAASGGKSIMTKDILGDVQLTVSDIRSSILTNLKKRFAEAGIYNYKSLIADLTKPVQLESQQFDLIIADVPCTGSGTWGRTPEQLYYFDEKQISAYAAVQKKIVTNIIPHLKSGGYLLYITCSVFKKENEEQVEFLKEKFPLQGVKIEVLEGYDKKADTLFAALFQQQQ